MRFVVTGPRELVRSTVNEMPAVPMTALLAAGSGAGDDLDLDVLAGQCERLDAHRCPQRQTFAEPLADWSTITDMCSSPMKSTAVGTW
jgi:hypothetical protein